MYSLAYGSVFSLAPKKYRIGSMNASATAMKSSPIIMLRLTTLLSTLLQALYFFLPRKIESIVAAPAPTRVPKAVDRFISGNVTARPEIAMGPTPWPMYMLSIMLYSDDAVIAIIAGSAYFFRSFPISSVPRSVGIATFCCSSILHFLRFIHEFNLEDQRCISWDV